LHEQNITNASLVENCTATATLDMQQMRPTCIVAFPVIVRCYFGTQVDLW